MPFEIIRNDITNMQLKSGYVLSKSNRFDVIISYFFEFENYNIHEINEVLFHYEENLLGLQK